MKVSLGTWVSLVRPSSRCIVSITSVFVLTSSVPSTTMRRSPEATGATSEPISCLG